MSVVSEPVLQNYDTSSVYLCDGSVRLLVYLNQDRKEWCPSQHQ